MSKNEVQISWKDSDAHIKEGLNLLEAYADATSDWYWEQDHEFRFTKFVGSDAEYQRISLTKLIGKRRWDLEIYPTEICNLEEHIHCCEQHRPFRNFEYEVIGSNGDTRCFSISGVPLFDKEGKFTGYRGIGTDITEHYQNRREMLKQEMRLNQVVHRIPVAGFAIDKTHQVTDWNSTCERLTGVEATKIKGTRLAWQGFYSEPRPLLADLVVDEAPAHTFKHYYGTQFRRSSVIPDAIEAEGYFPDILGGSWLLFTATPLKDDEGKIFGAVETFQDISFQKEQEQQILRQAHFDSLTGLPNRFLAIDRLTMFLQEADRKNTKVAVLLLDLDQFKKVNDILGHDVGDQLLIECASRLQNNICSNDTIARLGADEFIVMMEDVSSVDEVEIVARKILKSFREVFKLDGRDLLLTTSIGISISPTDSRDPQELFRHAELAMYHAKESGRNMYHFFSQQLNAGISRRLQLEEHLSSALEKGELSVHYQPVIEINSGRLEGAEALLRWKNPKLGQVSPEEFIPIAEQTGLIMPIGYYVLSESLLFAHRWFQRHQSHLKMAVNLSPLQFRDKKLIKRIEAELSRYRLPGSSLKLEITEGVLLGNQEHVQKSIEALTQLGTHLSMDDFGTGYSSLNYLRQYPFDVLKIDRSFIQGFETDETAPALIDATIAMAHSLGLEVVAEGVETDTQFNYLKQRGCNYAQGYLFSKPIPEEEFFNLFGQTGE